MATENKQKQSIFPDLPRETPVLDKDGNFMPLWDLGLSSLFQALQDNYKNEGIVFPQLTIDQLNEIEAIYAPYIGYPLPQNNITNRTQVVIPDISGQTVFDSTNRVPKQFIITYDNSTPPNVNSASWLQLNVMLTGTVNPNGTVAGVLNWLYYNITGTTLYICTASGSALSAIWTAI